MAKAKKSVEEELELATVVKGSSSKGFRIPSNPSNKVKTNNFFKMMNNKTNVLTSQDKMAVLVPLQHKVS